jgi:hypothetical protein
MRCSKRECEVLDAEAVESLEERGEDVTFLANRPLQAFDLAGPLLGSPCFVAEDGGFAVVEILYHPSQFMSSVLK